MARWLGRWLTCLPADLSACRGLLALRAFWSDPVYEQADHRAAVRTLAAGWRPGDLILVNAGWVWTPLHVYWPTAADGTRWASAAPPPLAPRQRLLDVAQGAALAAPSFAAPGTYTLDVSRAIIHAFID